jgi:hypothetical protein
MEFKELVYEDVDYRLFDQLRMGSGGGLSFEQELVSKAEFLSFLSNEL